MRDEGGREGIASARKNTRITTLHVQIQHSKQHILLYYYSNIVTIRPVLEPKTVCYRF